MAPIGGSHTLARQEGGARVSAREGLHAGGPRGEETCGAGALLGWAGLLGWGGSLGYHCRLGQQAEEEGVSGPAGKTGWAIEKEERNSIFFLSQVYFKCIFQIHLKQFEV